MARVSFVVQSSCSCELDTAIRCHTSCCAGRPLWAGFCYLRGAVAAQLLPIGATCPVGHDSLTGWDQLFLSFLWLKFSAQLSKSLPSGATFIKHIVYTFFITVLGFSVF